MSELPLNWSSSKLEELFVFVVGGDWGKDSESADEDYVDVLCIRGSEFKHWKTNKGKTASVRRIKKSSLETRKLYSGDILIEISGGGPDQPVGRTVLIDEDSLTHHNELDKVCTNFLRLARPSSHINSAYLNYYLQNFYNTGEITNYQGGSNNLRNLKFKEYVTISIPIAPLNEQIRIANKLDRVLAKVDVAQARLEKIPTLLKRFRQSVLAAATSGELTREWRRENKVAKWEEIPLEELIETTANGLSKRSGSRGADITILRLADFKDANRVYGNERKIKLDEKEVEKYSLKSGDILVIRVNGSVDLAGKFIEYQTTKDIEGFCDHFIRIRLNHQRILSTYLKFVANEGNGREFLKSNLSTSAGQNTINQGSVKGLIVPLPTINEQKEIVRRVESLFALANAVEKQYLAAKQRLDRLSQSVLAKAFRGELVPQDPNDEPASELLARIKASRVTEAPNQTRKSATRKAIRALTEDAV
jgi:type I restriction enzyme S subunit